MHADNFLRRFYRNYLKKIKGVETLRNLLIKRYKLIKLSDYPHKKLISQPAQKKEETILKCRFHKPPEFTPVTPQGSYISPEISVYEIKNIAVIAGSDCLLDREHLIHPDNYDVNEHICSLEQHKVGRFTPKEREARIPIKPEKVIEKGIFLLGDGAGNYAHFITEVIPRLIALDNKSLYPDYPIIADGWIGRPLMKILSFFNKKNRAIISLNQWQSIIVNNLIYPPRTDSTRF